MVKKAKSKTKTKSKTGKRSKKDISLFGKALRGKSVLQGERITPTFKKGDRVSWRGKHIKPEYQDKKRRKGTIIGVDKKGQYAYIAFDEGRPAHGNFSDLRKIRNSKTCK